MITNTTFADEGGFQCFATNRAGKDVINITLFMTTDSGSWRREGENEEGREGERKGEREGKKKKGKEGERERRKERRRE